MNAVQSVSSRWPHRAAWVLALATLLLIMIGALVTTYKAGMAVPDYPNTFGYGMFSYPMGTWWTGPRDIFLEHGHRMMGSLVGMVAIVFCLLTWTLERRAWVKWLAGGTLLLVIVQGLLGGFRVLFNEQTLAMIHGCIAHAFFGVCAVVLVCTSKRWEECTPIQKPHSSSLKLMAITTMVLVYIQIFFGAWLRHFTSPHAIWAHLILAVVVTLQVIWLAISLFRAADGDKFIRLPASSLLGLLLLQVVWGVMSWASRFGLPHTDLVVQPFGPLHVISTTGHVVTGAVLFGVCVATTLWTFRRWAVSTAVVPATQPVLEAVR